MKDADTGEEFVFTPHEIVAMERMLQVSPQNSQDVLELPVIRPDVTPIPGQGDSIMCY